MLLGKAIFGTTLNVLVFSKGGMGTMKAFQKEPKFATLRKDIRGLVGQSAEAGNWDFVACCTSSSYGVAMARNAKCQMPIDDDDSIFHQDIPEKWALAKNGRKKLRPH